MNTRYSSFIRRILQLENVFRSRNNTIVVKIIWKIFIWFDIEKWIMIWRKVGNGFYIVLFFCCHVRLWLTSFFEMVGGGSKIRTNRIFWINWNSTKIYWTYLWVVLLDKTWWKQHLLSSLWVKMNATYYVEDVVGRALLGGTIQLKVVVERPLFNCS